MVDPGDEVSGADDNINGEIVTHMFNNLNVDNFHRYNLPKPESVFDIQYFAENPKPF